MHACVFECHPPASQLLGARKDHPQKPAGGSNPPASAELLRGAQLPGVPTGEKGVLTDSMAAVLPWSPLQRVSC
jgi:hypothetical protein